MECGDPNNNFPLVLEVIRGGKEQDRRASNYVELYELIEDIMDA